MQRAETGQVSEPSGIPSTADVIGFYEALPEIYSAQDGWLRTSRRWVQRFIAREYPNVSTGEHAYGLNLGSGGLSYGIPEESLIHIDLHAKHCKKGQKFVVADIQNLPLLDKSFRTCLCVGSVLNHCDAAAVIFGIERVVARGGQLILDFETTRSLELMHSASFGKSAAVIDTFYHDREIRLWAYSEDYVRSLLASNGFVIRRRSSCHHLSPLAYLLCRDSNIASKFHLLDPIARRIPIIRKLASHVIYACQLCP